MEVFTTEVVDDGAKRDRRGQLFASVARYGFHVFDFGIRRAGVDVNRHDCRRVLLDVEVYMRDLPPVWVVEFNREDFLPILSNAVEMFKWEDRREHPLYPANSSVKQCASGSHESTRWSSNHTSTGR